MRIKKTLSLLALALLCPIYCSYAQDKLTWNECARIAVFNNPELVSAYEQIKQAVSDKDISASSMMPQIDSDASVKRHKTEGRPASDTYSYGISASQLVFDGFKTASELSGALKDLQAARYNYAVVSSDVRLNLRSCFVGLIRAQELISITKDIAQRRKQNFELVKLRYEGGREHKGALLTAEADMAQADFEQSQAERSVILVQRELAKELGAEGNICIEAVGQLCLDRDYAAKPDIDILAEDTPFIKELISRKEAARYNLNSKESDFFPKVYVNGALSRTGDKWLPKKDEWSAGASVSLPLFEGGQRLAEVSKARSRLEQAGADERSGRYGVLVTLERSWKDLQDAISNVSVQEKFLQAAEERAKITRSQYSTGLASFNDWIIIEDNLVKAQKTYLNTRADMLIAEAYWIQATGGMLEYDKK
ncbi:MAG: TolC family protein [Candidatus Omnitrophica bacterium]|nr:TolC family protein [Candidatus Omnitrophota bacterium]